MESSVKHLCDSNVNEVGHLTQNIAMYQSKLYKLRIFIFFYLFVFTVLSNSMHSVNNHGNTSYLSDKRANISLRTVCSLNNHHPWKHFLLFFRQKREHKIEKLMTKKTLEKDEIQAILTSVDIQDSDEEEDDENDQEPEIKPTQQEEQRTQLETVAEVS